MRERIDVLVMTPLPEEMAALVQVLGPPDRKGAEPLATSVWSRVPLAGGPGVVVAFMPADMDQLPAATAVRQMLMYWQPRCFALLGIAASLRDTAALGDVVVAKYVWHYDARRKVAQRSNCVNELYAPIPIAINSNFGISYAQHFLADKDAFVQWQNECLDRGRAIFEDAGASPVPSSAPRLFIDDFATGSAVVDSQAEREAIASLSRKLLALEMESAGVLSSLGDLPVVVIRGLSDAASGKGKDDEPVQVSFRQYAAENAARSLVRLLRVAPLPARRSPERPGRQALLLAGGVAVLVSLSMVLLRQGPFRADHSSPAPSAIPTDAGSAGLPLPTLASIPDTTPSRETPAPSRQPSPPSSPSERATHRDLTRPLAGTTKGDALSKEAATPPVRSAAPGASSVGPTHSATPRTSAVGSTSGVDSCTGDYCPH
ncbi:phosphorylase family protein [Sorangium sp. So ce1182]|uniref:5'-methylthioadenosine/S-adenosylhomocysteine nucleosidase family protein n=1 Tax=Sorangium sp. So ce1182 TaxID=3133334 RepID=UPI003F61AFE3